MPTIYKDTPFYKIIFLLILYQWNQEKTKHLQVRACEMLRVSRL